MSKSVGVVGVSTAPAARHLERQYDRLMTAPEKGTDQQVDEWPPPHSQLAQGATAYPDAAVRLVDSPRIVVVVAVVEVVVDIVVAAAVAVIVSGGGGARLPCLHFKMVTVLSVVRSMSRRSVGQSLRCGQLRLPPPGIHRSGGLRTGPPGES